MKKSIHTFMFAVLGIVAVSCNGTGSTNSTLGLTGGSVGSDRQSVVGDSCQSGDPAQICLGVSFVSWTDGNGVAVADQQLAIHDIQVVNQLWSQCKIGFQIEKYEAIAPGSRNFAYGAETQNQLDEIRKSFEEDNRLLVVLTGPWGAVKNAWTQVPGAGVYGAILEASVATYAPIMGHELGHYLGLPHPVESPGEVPNNLMNWLIRPESTQLDPGQCDSARATAMGFWNKMTR